MWNPSFRCPLATCPGDPRRYLRRLGNRWLARIQWAVSPCCRVESVFDRSPNTRYVGRYINPYLKILVQVRSDVRVFCVEIGRHIDEVLSSVTVVHRQAHASHDVACPEQSVRDGMSACCFVRKDAQRAGYPSASRPPRSVAVSAARRSDSRVQRVHRGRTVAGRRLSRLPLQPIVLRHPCPVTVLPLSHRNNIRNRYITSLNTNLRFPFGCQLVWFDVSTRFRPTRSGVDPGSGPIPIDPPSYPLERNWSVVGRC